MAYQTTCAVCNREITVRSGGTALCDDCNGVNKAKQQEKERWAGLTIEQKCDELKNRIDNMPDPMFPPRF